MKLRDTFLLSALLFSLLLTGCGVGGGGGGGGSDEPAAVDIDAFPREVDSGDRITVNIRIRETNILGIALKLRYPIGLKYVRNSALLSVERTISDVGPTDEKSNSESTYLVFYFAQSDFGSNNDGILQIVLQGQAKVDNEPIEVDADLDDPTISNSSEFNLSTPYFDPQDEIYVKVRDSSAAVATPTATPSTT